MPVAAGHSEFSRWKKPGTQSSLHGRILQRRRSRWCDRPITTLSTSTVQPSSDKTHVPQVCCKCGCIAQHAAGTKVLCVAVHSGACDYSKTITSCITIFVATMSTDGECVCVTNPLWGYRNRASAEVIETGSISESQRMCSPRRRDHQSETCLIRVLGTVCLRRRRCIYMSAWANRWTIRRCLVEELSCNLTN